MNTIDLVPISFEKMTPEEFLKLTREERAGIKNVDIVPASLGDLNNGDFGYLLIERRDVNVRAFDRPL
jgi:hypothetical protein